MLLRNFFGNLAVGKKLAASFTVLVVLLLIISAVSIFSLDEYNHRALIVDRANAAEIALLEARSEEKNFQIRKDSKFRLSSVLCGNPVL